MLIAAFLVTAFAGVVLGIWLSSRAVKGQMPINPVRIWAFTEIVKKKTIEAYAEELSSAMELKYPDDRLVTAPLVATFIREYTAAALERHSNE